MNGGVTLLKFIFSSWKRKKRRMGLLIVGMVVISIGLSSLTALTTKNKGTVDEVLKKNWHAQYHILVVPADENLVKKGNELPANYLNNIHGGITMKQYNQLKAMDAISVAAPIANLGFLSYDVMFKQIDLKDLDKDSVYRITLNMNTTNGMQTFNHKVNYYLTTDGMLSTVPLFSKGGLWASGYLQLNAIDPVEEAKLVGLNNAMISKGTSHYFGANDKVNVIVGENQKNYQFPVITSSNVLKNTTYTYTLSKLNLNLSSEDKEKAAFVKIQHDGLKYLDSLNGKAQKKYMNNNEKVYRQFLGKLTNGQFASKDTNNKNIQIQFGSTLIQPGKVTYKKVPSPYPKQWTISYEVVPINSSKLGGIYQYGSYRDLILSSDQGKYITPQWIGIFEPQKLSISKNPLTKLPMGNYQSPESLLKLDEHGKPLNPPQSIYPTDNPSGFLLQPPSALTTIDAASQILGDKPISAIRIKVKGVKELNDASQTKLEKLAKKVKDVTGLNTLITLGSSPEPVLIHIPPTKRTPGLGWAAMPWIHLGASYSIYKNTKVGFSGILAIMTLVAMIYVLSTQFIHYLVRKKEFAVLLSIGWRPVNLVKLIITESIIFGAVSSVLSAGITGFLLNYWHHDSGIAFMIVGFMALVIYLLGSLIPCFLVYRISPMESMKTGETRSNGQRFITTKGIVMLAVNHLLGRLPRYALSMFSMIVPTVLLGFYLFVTFQLKGILHTSWLGQYAELQIGLAHFISLMITLMITMLTISEIMWQNINERRSEIALFKAIGWRNKTVRQLIIFEACGLGFVSGLISLLISTGAILFIYHQINFSSVIILLITAIVPIIVAIISALIPAEAAVRVSIQTQLKEQ
jgi:FKBP-type peptidyl-prolyl cis-trans isomerase